MKTLDLDEQQKVNGGMGMMVCEAFDTIEILVTALGVTFCVAVTAAVVYLYTQN